MNEIDSKIFEEKVSDLKKTYLNRENHPYVLAKQGVIDVICAGKVVYIVHTNHTKDWKNENSSSMGVGFP